eukprot:TRINITY_DN14691_c0_g1_i1.p1 TRINITY_DN14691_c0_g1~~TRINITY_DN14691_c0_g1_i1.p1  ORF type:complete len:290 (+),score=48.53 TRINITY_DN14691_c0_g1_i1:62-871(+)
MTSNLVAGKVVIVTGGASGIGRGAVEEFAAEGARVLIADVDTKNGTALADELNQKHSTAVAHFCFADVATSSGATTIVETCLKVFGGIDVLFNNAGIQPANSNVPLHELDESVWDRVLSINLKSVFLVSKAVIPTLLKNPRGGVIINNSSVQGILSQKGVPVYSASKGAVNSMTRNMALDYAPHIRVLALCPGAVDTPLHRTQYNLENKAAEDSAMSAACAPHPWQRPGTPNEIGKVVVFLASDRASFMSGTCVPVDGALLARGAWASP